MKKIKRVLIAFGLLMVVPILVKAECDFKEKNKLQSLASNLNFTYNYKQINDNEQFPGVEFDITITNLQPELYIVEQNSMKTYNYNGNREITIGGYSDGSSIKFMVYAKSGTCQGEHLITNYVSLPPYNRYYSDEICKDVTDYQLCNRWSNVSLTYDEFVEKVANYKREDNHDNINNVVVKDDIIEKVIEFLSKYSTYLFGSIIVVCGALIYYLDKKDSFDLK